MVLQLDSYDENERMMRSHLKLIHGVYVEPKLTLAQLRECHDTAHADGLTGNDGWTRLAVKHDHVSRETIADVSRETNGGSLEVWTWD